jgi:hypothetical protein
MYFSGLASPSHPEAKEALKEAKHRVAHSAERAGSQDCLFLSPARSCFELVPTSAAQA